MSGFISLLAILALDDSRLQAATAQRREQHTTVPPGPHREGRRGVIVRYHAAHPEARRIRNLDCACLLDDRPSCLCCRGGHCTVRCCLYM